MPARLLCKSGDEVLIRVMRFRGRPPDVAAEARFSETGGTIGRSSQCTLPLPDPDRHISRIQAEINFEGDQFVLVDRGSASCIQRNGVDVGPGQTVALQDGDELHVGDYVLRVELPAVTMTVPDDSSRPYDPFADLVGNPAPKAEVPKDHPLAGGAAPLIPDDFDPFGKSALVPRGKNAAAMPQPAARREDSLDALFGLGEPPGAASRGAKPPDDLFGGPPAHNTASAEDPFAALQAPPSPGFDPVPDQAPEIHNPMPLPTAQPLANDGFLSWKTPEGAASSSIAGKTIAATARMKPPPAIPGGGTPAGPTLSRDAPRRFAQPRSHSPDVQALLDALLAGAALQELPKDPARGGKEPRQLDEEVMERMGALLRHFVQGAIDLLATRATLKTEMRSPMTVIAPQGNNPLKFSPDASTALALLMASPMPRGFMSPDMAVQDAMNDLVAHQVGVLAGMRAALQGLLARFEPKALEARLTNKSMLDSMLPKNRKAKLWEQFENTFNEVSKEAEDDFEALFSREFVRAYEAQIKSLEDRDTIKKPRR
ncbi:type VI secretion system-associated FHA domain protein TagH [Noviherbaspirillum sp.]|uniref:type VI secretion system-associated FHA domain protein TagH n=1 Tax=Noviherbaspirillum sp. TaxID=1926288 RepID=UPI002D79F52F|nr:type VI secretion system-associated FHA domain protein TagH [Noviherbaspirillum sp.]